MSWLGELAFPEKWRDFVWAKSYKQSKCPTHNEYPNRHFKECFQCAVIRSAQQKKKEELDSAARMVAIVQYAIRSMKDDED